MSYVNLYSASFIIRISKNTFVTDPGYHVGTPTRNTGPIPAKLSRRVDARVTAHAIGVTTHDSRPWTYMYDRLRGPTMYGKNVVHRSTHRSKTACHRLVLGLPREALKTSPSSAGGLH